MACLWGGAARVYDCHFFQFRVLSCRLCVVVLCGSVTREQRHGTRRARGERATLRLNPSVPKRAPRAQVPLRRPVSAGVARAAVHASTAGRRWGRLLPWGPHLGGVVSCVIVTRKGGGKTSKPLHLSFMHICCVCCVCVCVLRVCGVCVLPVFV